MKHWKPVLLVALTAVAYTHLLFLTWQFAGAAHYPWQPYAGKSREFVLALLLLETALDYVPVSAFVGLVMACFLPKHRYIAAVLACLPCTVFIISVWPLPTTPFSAATYLLRTLWALLLPCAFAWLAAWLVSGKTFPLSALRARPGAPK
jgi:hypothetical protein